MRLKVNTKEAVVCRKCKKGMDEVPIVRHHKGNDAWLGMYNRGIAANYSNWHHCIRLCLDCHCRIHYIYYIRLQKHIVLITPRQALKLRKQFIQLCDDWLADKITGPKRIPTAFRKQFQESWEAWQEDKREIG